LIEFKGVIGQKYLLTFPIFAFFRAAAVLASALPRKGQIVARGIRYAR
jgi:hypothetical protein